jgi:hypothetical protein
MSKRVFSVLDEMVEPMRKDIFWKKIKKLKAPYCYEGGSIVSIGTRFLLNMDDDENLGYPCISITFEGSSSEQKDVQDVLQACKTLDQLLSEIYSFL